MKKILSLVLIAITLFAVSCDDSEPTLNTACIMARDYVKKMITFPEEAEFESDIRGRGDAVNGFIVYEKFTAPNAFGVRKTYVYKCNMKYLGGDKYENSSWKCSDLIIEDVQTGQQWRNNDH
ncbi:MAG: hypothetical protein ACI4V2_06120 [Alloprevotella sp.]